MGSQQTCTKNNDLRLLYKSARNKANALLSSEKRKNFQHMSRSSEKNAAKNWTIGNQIRGGKGKHASSILRQKFGAVFVTLSDEFNAFFSSSGQSSLLPGVTANSMPSVLESAGMECRTDDLRCILLGFNRRKTAGFHGISVDVLCRNFHNLKDVLLAIINFIIKTQIITEGLKYGLVIPLCKNEKKIG